MVGGRLKQKSLVLCLIVAAMFAATTSAFAEFPLYEPNYDYRITPPYESAGVAEKNELQGVTYKLTDCVWTMTNFDLFKPAIEVHRKERTVTIFVPGAMDLTNERVINGLIVSGWKAAWKYCFSSYVQNDTNFTEFAGVRVLVVQRKERIIEAGPVLVGDDNSIYISRLTNLATDRKNAKIQAEQTAIAQAQQVTESRQSTQRAEETTIAQAQQATESRQPTQRAEETSATFNFILIAALMLAAVIALVRLLPPILTRIRWFLSPHPAIRELRNATRNRNATFVNPNALADALLFSPANSTEAELARKDIAKLKKDVAEKSEILREQEELEELVVEMERKKTRVEVLLNRRNNHGK